MVSGIAHEVTLRHQLWICDDLPWWLIQKTFRGLHPFPYLVRPRVLGYLKLQYYKKVVGPLLTFILPLSSSEVY